MWLKAAFSEAITKALAEFLALDPEHRRLLRPLAGKVIAVEFVPLGHRITLSPTPDTILVLSGFPGPADVTLKGSPLAFVRLMLSSRSQKPLFQGEIEVIGDVDVARRLQVLLQRLDLDWESLLADLTGDRFARSLAGSIQAAAAWHRHAFLSFQWNLAEFLQEETRLLPAPLEAEDLYREISHLRDDVERLEASLKRLKIKVCRGESPTRPS